MKKKIIVFSLFLAMCVQTTVFADISTGNGILDRDFDADRTVYYVEITDEVIPDIAIDGYEVVNKATSPAEKDGKIIKENVTILKNTETGIRYRFIFEKNEKSNIVVSETSLSSEGLLTIRGEIDKEDVFKVIILKPEEKYSEKSVKWEDLTVDEMEKGVLDILEVKSVSKFTSKNTERDAITPLKRHINPYLSIFDPFPLQKKCVKKCVKRFFRHEYMHKTPRFYPKIEGFFIFIEPTSNGLTEAVSNFTLIISVPLSPIFPEITEFTQIMEFIFFHYFRGFHFILCLFLYQ